MSEREGYGVREGSRRKLFLAVAGIAVLVAAAVAVPAGPAAAATTAEPVAIAVGRTGDVRVLQIGGDGTSNSSPIVMAPYVPNTDVASSRQRWSFELGTGSGIPTFAYRIRSPATGKCLNSSGATPQNKAPIILYTCNGTTSGTNEIWWMDSDPWPGGVSFRNLRDDRCVDITGASTANNAPLESYTCQDTDTAWNQLFKTRTGSFDCTVRDSDWRAVHIRDAQIYPNRTFPSWPGKTVPGRAGGNEPLHRMVDDALATANYNASVAYCKETWGPNYATGGKQCDEYPFKTTYEPAAPVPQSPKRPRSNVLPCRQPWKQHPSALRQGLRSACRRSLPCFIMKQGMIWPAEHERTLSCGYQMALPPRRTRKSCEMY